MSLNSVLVEALRLVFRRASRYLRRTGLQRVQWICVLHSRLFSVLWKRDRIPYGDGELYVDPRDRHLAKKLALYGEYEKYERDLLMSLAQPGSVVVDVGANIGLHTIPLARRVGPSGFVIACEPDPDNYKLLARNLELNNVLNVRTEQVALSCEDGQAVLYQSLENRGGLSLQKKNVSGRSASETDITVKTIRGDSLLADVKPSISLIKIDVEGAEPLVLRGLEATLRENEEIKLVFEFWPRHVRNFAIDPSTFLQSLVNTGFRLGVIDSQAKSVSCKSVNEIVGLGEQAENPLNILGVRGEVEEVVVQ